MWGLLMLAAAVGFALYSRRGAPPIPFGVAAGDVGLGIPPVSGSSAGAAGAVVGSPADLGQTMRDDLNADNKRTTGLAATGASVGSVAGPAGAYIGGYIGLVLGSVWSIVERGTDEETYLPRDTRRYFGLPYFPATVADGELQLAVPQTGGAALVVRFAESRLHEVFPGQGAYEACRRSGMLEWRPNDQVTPFSAALYGTPAGLQLLQWEIDHVRGSPDDYDHGGASYRWIDAWRLIYYKRDVDAA